MIRFAEASRTDARIFNNEVESESRFRSFRRHSSNRVNFFHLREKLREAADWLTAVHQKVDLPWNVENEWPHRRHYDQQQTWDIVEGHLRYAGWLKTVAKSDFAELPEVIKLLEKTQSSAGRNSPRTTVNLARLVAKWHSPHELEKWLRHAKWRANQILRPYGVKVAMADLYTVAEERGNKRVGKGAFVAAARTLARYTVDGAHYGLDYWQDASVKTRESRQEIFVKARGLAEAFKADRKVYLAAKALVQSGQAADFRVALQQLETEFTADNTDGVEGFVANETSTFRGLSIQAMIVCEEKSASASWFVRSSEGESFHSILGRPRDAAREAVAAWRRQRAMAAEGLSGLEEAMRHLGLDPDMMSVLVKVEDSYSAGNCHPGTASWMRENGLIGRKFVGAPQLARFWSDPRVRRVILQAITRVADGVLEKVA